MESRVYVSAKKLKDCTGTIKDLPEPERIEKLTRVIE